MSRARWLAEELGPPLAGVAGVCDLPFVRANPVGEAMVIGSRFGRLGPAQKLAGRGLDRDLRCPGDEDRVVDRETSHGLAGYRLIGQDNHRPSQR